MNSELLIAIVGGVVAILLATPIASYLWEKSLRDRVSVRRLTSQKDHDLVPMLELYSALFPEDGTNYSCDAVSSWLPDEDGQKKHTAVDGKDIILVAKAGRSVVGFLFCHYYPKTVHAIISYYGVDKESDAGRLNAPVPLLRTVIKALKRERPPCKMLVFELQKPDTTTDKRESSERSARHAVFRKRALSLGLHAFIVDVDYRRPRLNLVATSEGEPLTLMCVPLRKTHKLHAIRRETVMRVLEVLHLYGYGDYYEADTPEHTKYHEYLQGRLAHYRDRLPDSVPVH